MSFTNPPVLNGAVLKILKQGTSIYLAGYFTQINAATRKYLTKVNESGAFDSSFPDFAPSSFIYSLAYDSLNSCLLVGGNFTVPSSYLACLDSSGTNIASFVSSPVSNVRNLFFYDNGGISNIFFNDYGGGIAIYKYENLSLKSDLGVSAWRGDKNIVKIGTAIYFINYSTNKIQRYNLLTSVLTDVFNYAKSSGFLYKVNDNLFYVNSAEEVYSIF